MNRLFKLTRQEFARQRATLNLIASENYPSPKVLELLGSVWQNKYAEGYPGKRYYAGNVYADQMESYVQELAIKAFKADGYGVNLQAYSGSPANAAVYLTALEPGDMVISLSLAGGGHLSHLHGTNSYLKFYKSLNYEVRQAGGRFEIDQDDYAAKLKQHRPKLVIIGFSAYPPQYQFGELCRLAHEAGALVLADIAHIAGLVAAGRHDSPFRTGLDGADFVTTTTHKTLRGPRGALVFARNDWTDQLNKTVFPGTQGGPHLHQIAAVGQCLMEVLDEDSYPDEQPFDAYIKNVIDSAKAMEAGLISAGIDIVSPTATHLVLAKLPDAVDSLVLQRQLEELGIITNRNLIPQDPKTAWKPSGLRLGTAALASRGLMPELAQEMGCLVGDVINRKVTPGVATERVGSMIAKLAWPY